MKITVRNYFSIICYTFKVMKITVRQAMSQEAYMLFYEYEPGSCHKLADTTANVSKTIHLYASQYLDCIEAHVTY